MLIERMRNRRTDFVPPIQKSDLDLPVKLFRHPKAWEARVPLERIWIEFLSDYWMYL